MIVGAAVKNWMALRSISSTTRVASNAASTCRVPPVSRHCSAWERPARWNIGINCNCGEPATMSPISMAKPARERINAPLVRGIAFGRPVVPLVCRIATVELTPSRSSGRGGGGPSRSAAGVQPGRSSAPSTTRCSGRPTASIVDAEIGSASTATGPRSSNRSSSSAAPRRQLTRAGTAPARINASVSMRYSGLLRATTATRSPEVTPAAAHPPARRSTRSSTSRYVRPRPRSSTSATCSPSVPARHSRTWIQLCTMVSPQSVRRRRWRTGGRPSARCSSVGRASSTSTASGLGFQ